MKTLETIYKKLNSVEKTELETHKVELAIVDELKKYAKGYDKYYNEGKGLEQKAERVKKELKEIVSALYKWDELGNSIADDIIRSLRKADEAADELGIKPQQIAEYKNAEASFKNFAKAAKRFGDIAKKLDK